MANPVIPIDLAMTRVFLVQGAAGWLLVDTGTAGSADRILAQMAQHDVAPDDVRLILITHGHTDHTGSAAALRERTGAPVAIHAQDADDLRAGDHQPDSLQPTNWLLDAIMRVPFLRRVFPSSDPCPPDILFEEPCRLDDSSSPLGAIGIAGEVIATPGHTPGSVSVLLDSGEAIVGDMVMGQLMGLIRKPGPPIVAWDLETNWQSLHRLLDRSPRLIYPSHGGPFEAETVSRWLEGVTSR